MTYLRRFILPMTCLYVLMAFSCSCQSSNQKPDPPEPEPDTFVFAKGADISWVTQMEKDGIKFYNSKGEERECTALMKELGMNAIRLRVWVDPTTDGWCGKEDVLIKARRANNLGMRILIDFHYSNWWADPSKQNKPAAWKDFGINELANAVSGHTKEILNALKAEGITPEWVQVGNETTDGMLWDTGKASKSMANYAKLSNAGYTASKEVFPDTKVIIHIDNGYDQGRFTWIFDGLRSNGARWDVIGMSLYPAYRESQDNIPIKTTVAQCVANMKYVISRYNKEVMVCEVGMPWNRADDCYAFLSDLMTQSLSIADNKCLGVFYWEPEANPTWNSNPEWEPYSLGAFDGNFKPTKAMDVWKNF